MTILPKKKERNQAKGSSGGSEAQIEDHQHQHHQHYHHSSPPRVSWGSIPGRPDRGAGPSSSSSLTLPNEGTPDASKRTSETDALLIGLAESGPSHGSKRRHRETRSLYGTRSKSKSCSTSSSSCSTSSSTSSPSTSSPEGLLDLEPATSAAECSSEGSVVAPEEGGVPPVVSLLPVASVVRDPGSASPSGYNSGDEYGDSKPANSWTPEELVEMERRFEKKMRKKGLIIRKMGEDGACLFRAAADQVYGDQDMHSMVRKLCMDYMAKNGDYFSQYVTEDFNEYIERKRVESSHGNHVEIQALSEMFNRPIEVYHYNADPINIFQGCHQSENEPIRLSYHQNVHYNSVVDPFKATVGVGLGLPAFKPGLADKNLIDNAIRTSEDQELEKAMLEDKLRATDWEATNEAIEEQVARESYLDWLRESEKRAIKNKKSKLASASATSSATGSEPCLGGQVSHLQQQANSPSPSRQSPKASSSGMRSSSSQCDKVTDFSVVETASFVNRLPPQMFGISDFDSQEEGDILARVLAQSQQEYLDSLKRNAESVGTSAASGSNSSPTGSSPSSSSKLA